MDSEKVLKSVTTLVATYQDLQDEVERKKKRIKELEDLVKTAFDTNDSDWLQFRATHNL